MSPSDVTKPTPMVLSDSLRWTRWSSLVTFVSGALTFALVWGQHHWQVLHSHYLPFVILIKLNEGLGLILDVPGRLSLMCSELVIERQPDRTEPIKPRPSDREFSAIVPSRTRPSPTEWIEWLRRLGLEAVWRRYGGEAEPTSKVPDDYTGWLIQTPERIGESQAGLFFFHCGPNENGDLVVHVQSYYGDNCHGLWVACGRVVGSMSGSVVRCGNCRFTGKQWLEYLDRGGTANVQRVSPA